MYQCHTGVIQVQVCTGVLRVRVHMGILWIEACEFTDTYIPIRMYMCTYVQYGRRALTLVLTLFFHQLALGTTSLKFDKCMMHTVLSPTPNTTITSTQCKQQQCAYICNIKCLARQQTPCCVPETTAVQWTSTIMMNEGQLPCPIMGLKQDKSVIPSNRNDKTKKCIYLCIRVDKIAGLPLCWNLRPFWTIPVSSCQQATILLRLVSNIQHR